MTLENVADKSKIYKGTSNLKGVKNSNGFAYQIRDVLPERLQEMDTWQRQMIGENKQKSRQNTAHKIDMSVKGNKLMVNNSVYKKKVQEISAGDLLQISDEERDKIQMARLAKTDIHHEEHNQFQAYILESGDINEVRAAYKHLKLKHPEATHVTVAYRLTGIGPEYADYEDNRETGAGSRLLKAIVNAQKMDVAIYLVRYHSSQNLGVRRFTIFKDMAEKALELLAERENFFASTIPAHKLKVKYAKKTRTCGKVTGIRGGANFARSRITQPLQNTRQEDITPSNSLSELGSDTDPEVVIQAKHHYMRVTTVGAALMSRGGS